MIHIIGAGFTGLSLAWELQKVGLKVAIYEKNRVGGLISSHRSATHLRETAANGLLWTPRLEILAQELGVEFQPSQQEAKKRFIFYNHKPRRWPLNFWQTLQLLFFGLKFLAGKLFFKKNVPSDLTLERWSENNLGRPFTEVVLSAAVRGIFALTPKSLNAKAVLESFKPVAAFKKAKKYKPVTCAPKNGMGELIQALQQKLAAQNITVQMKEITSLKDLPLNPGDAVVIATSAWDAEKLLPKPGQLAQIQSVPLMTLTLVWPEGTETLQGFGCLFPPVEKFFSSGVLVNSCIFKNRGPNPTETWIISQDLQEALPEQIKAQVMQDRQRLFPDQQEPLEFHLTRWPRAIPAYDQHLQNFVEGYPQVAKDLAKENIFLAGNYLGKIGLAKIYDQNIVLAKKLKVHYG